MKNNFNRLYSFSCLIRIYVPFAHFHSFILSVARAEPVDHSIPTKDFIYSLTKIGIQSYLFGGFFFQKKKQPLLKTRKPVLSWKITFIYGILFVWAWWAFIIDDRRIGNRNSGGVCLRRCRKDHNKILEKSSKPQYLKPHCCKVSCDFCKLYDWFCWSLNH